MTAPSFTLFLIIFLEGYVVLSTELLAIRQIIPFTGSGTDTISIIIAAVLMPLAFGYFAGGRFRPKKKRGQFLTVRKLLLRNLAISSIFLTVGLSYKFLNWFFVDLIFFYTGIQDRIVLTLIYAMLFLICPVFLLGQTVPLISNYFSRQRLSLLAGKILFFSTLGSFAGAIFCTLILMAYLGVHHAVSVSVFCLFFLSLILSKKRFSLSVITTGLCLLLSLFLNSDYEMRRLYIVENNKYQMVQIEEPAANLRLMKINRNSSSGIDKDTKEAYFLYVRYIEENFIRPMDTGKKRDVLVLGAAGFTMGLKDTKNEYVFIDLDPGLKEIAEEKFLEEKLSKNKIFIAQPARAYLYQTDKKFDLIILDLFNGPSGSPEHLITREFFGQVKSALKNDGIVVANFFTTPNFSDRFSIRLDNTIRSVFPHVNRQVLRPFNSWNTASGWANIVYSFYNNQKRNNDEIYTDNLNSSMFDKAPQQGK